MRRSLLDHLSFANVAASLALFLALGGGATAIALKGKNTVTSDDIAPGQVKTSDLGRAAVTTAKLRNQAVTGAKVRADGLTGAQIDEATLSGLDADSLDGAILVSDQDSVVAGTVNLGLVPGVGRVQAQCSDTEMRIRYISDFSAGALAVWTDAGGGTATYEELANTAATGDTVVAAADSQGALVTYRLHRGQQSAPEIRTPKGTLTVSAVRSTPTIPDLCNFTVQGLVEP